MFKFVVLSVLLAAACAEPEPEPQPGAILGAPAPLYYSAPYSYYPYPAASYTKFGTGYVAGSPYYSAYPSIPHLIKKRSAPLALPSSYFASSPYYASTYAAPAIAAPYYSSTYYGAPAWSGATYAAPAHFIKKRSVALALPSTYITPTTYAAGAPLLTPTYAAGAPLIPSAPLYTTGPYAYSTYIKK